LSQNRVWCFNIQIIVICAYYVNSCIGICHATTLDVRIVLNNLFNNVQENKFFRFQAPPLKRKLFPFRMCSIICFLETHLFLKLITCFNHNNQLALCITQTFANY
jgi:hypothetical protein